MIRALVAQRVLLSLGCSAVVGTLGLQAYPFPGTHPLLGLIDVYRPGLFAAFAYTYATLWFKTPFPVATVGFSLLYIFVARWGRTPNRCPLPPSPPVAQRTDLFVVLGEQHHATRPGRARAPTWLVIPERGLYTGMLIVGAIGAGKTSACMYPSVEQVRGIPRSQGRADDYIEVDTPLASPLGRGS